MGAVGQVRPRRRKALRRLTVHPTESEQSGDQINNLYTYYKATMFTKTAFFIFNSCCSMGNGFRGKEVFGVLISLFSWGWIGCIRENK